MSNTPIGYIGLQGIIHNTEDSVSAYLKTLEQLRYGVDHLALEAAEHLRSITTPQVHRLKTRADDDPE